MEHRLLRARVVGPVAQIHLECERRFAGMKRARERLDQLCVALARLPTADAVEALAGLWLAAHELAERRLGLVGMRNHENPLRWHARAGKRVTVLLTGHPTLTDAAELPNDLRIDAVALPNAVDDGVRVDGIPQSNHHRRVLVRDTARQDAVLELLDAAHDQVFDARHELANAAHAQARGAAPE